MIAWSPGWGRNVELGSGQDETLRVLRSTAARNPRHDWHDAPPMRAFGKSSSTIHRHIHRMAELGVIAIQARRGCRGGIRFSFRPRRWKWSLPVRHALTLARMKLRDVVRAVTEPVQVVLAHAEPLPLFRIPEPSHGIAPTLQDVCALCGSLELVRAKVFERDGQYAAGRVCLDHDACARRRAE